MSDRGTQCNTPNYEVAKCTPITSCLVIRDAITARNESEIKFAQQSQCGYDTEPLVCCGNSAYFSEPAYFSFFTKEPTIEAPKLVSKRPPNLSVISANTLPNRTVCGIERETQRLIGATSVEIDEFPWMALIRYNDDKQVDAGFKCGGTLINNRYILTAAHCILTAPEPISVSGVRLGEWRLSTEPDCVENIALVVCADPVIDLKVIAKFPHPYFSSSNGDNDIGLLRMEKDVKYTNFIRPICLPPLNTPPPTIGTLMTVSGWGVNEAGFLADIKSKVEVPFITNDDCEKTVSRYTRLGVNQICAGGVEGKGACKGDSGGPLMATYVDDTVQWYQEGIVSRGRGCGRKGFPGVSTRVARYINWILNIIEEDNIQ